MRTHTPSSAVKWGNWREIRASEKGKLSLELYQKSDRVEVFLWRPENLANVRGWGWGGIPHAAFSLESISVETVFWCKNRAFVQRRESPGAIFTTLSRLFDEM